jgi:hypothetical protein
MWGKARTVRSSTTAQVYRSTVSVLALVLTKLLMNSVAGEISLGAGCEFETALQPV